MEIGVGSLIGGALKLGSNIFGNVKQRKAAKRQQARLKGLMQDNEDWFNRAYNEDVTQRADAQRLITLTQEAMRRNNQAASGTSAVMGGTTESVAAAKAANNQMMGDAISQIAADAASRKDAIESQYMSNKQALTGDLNAMDVQQMKQIAKGVQKAEGYADKISNLNDELGYIGK
jgi:hypothetical protein